MGCTVLMYRHRYIEGKCTTALKEIMFSLKGSQGFVTVPLPHLVSYIAQHIYHTAIRYSLSTLHASGTINYQRIFLPCLMYPLLNPTPSVRSSLPLRFFFGLKNERFIFTVLYLLKYIKRLPAFQIFQI